jgi:hypothetical protein
MIYNAALVLTSDIAFAVRYMQILGLDDLRDIQDGSSKPPAEGMSDPGPASTPVYMNEATIADVRRVFP